MLNRCSMYDQYMIPAGFRNLSEGISPSRASGRVHGIRALFQEGSPFTPRLITFAYVFIKTSRVMTILLAPAAASRVIPVLSQC